MNRILTATALTVLMASVALADVDFRWSSSSAQALDQTSVNLAAASTVLLYVSTDASVNFPGGNVTGPIQTSYGDDTYVGAAATTLSGRYTIGYQTPGTTGAGAGSDVGLYTYMVLVNLSYSTFTGALGGNVANIAAGTYYGVSSMSPVTLVQGASATPPGTPQSFTDSSDANGLGAIIQTTQVVTVPEPSTVALMLAGLGIVAMRMRRK